MLAEIIKKIILFSICLFLGNAYAKSVTFTGYRDPNNAAEVAYNGSITTMPIKS